MRYLLMIYSVEAEFASMSEAEFGAMMAGYGALEQELAAKKVKVGGEALEPTAKATCVRVRGGKPVITDGPFAETKEQLGGVYILDCADLDEAIAWAAKIPSARDGTIEIRPVWDYQAAER